MPKRKDGTSDGCTGVPDAIWRQCCEEHDEAYGKAGNFWDRMEADVALGKCIQKICRASEKRRYRWLSWGWGLTYFAGVRAFGPVFFYVPKWFKRSKQ